MGNFFSFLWSPKNIKGNEDDSETDTVHVQETGLRLFDVNTNSGGVKNEEGSAWAPSNMMPIVFLIIILGMIGVGILGMMHRIAKCKKERLEVKEEKLRFKREMIEMARMKRRERAEQRAREKAMWKEVEEQDEAEGDNGFMPQSNLCEAHKNPFQPNPFCIHCTEQDKSLTKEDKELRRQQATTTLSGIHKNQNTPNPFCRRCKWISKAKQVSAVEEGDESEEGTRQRWREYVERRNWLKKCTTTQPTHWSHPVAGPCKIKAWEEGTEKPQKTQAKKERKNEKAGQDNAKKNVA